MKSVHFQPYKQCAPVHGMRSRHRHLNRLFDIEDNDNRRGAAWQPRINVIDLEDKFEISAELPGMTKEQVNIELNNNILTLSGEKIEEHETKDRNCHRCERTYGKFHRSFRLSPEVESEKIEAKFDNGILTLSLPKSEKSVSKRIEIQTN